MTPLGVAIGTVNDMESNGSDPLLCAKVRGLLYGYDARWTDQPYTILSVESLTASDLWNPETGRKSRSFTVAGLLDVTATYAGRTVIIDHKSSSNNDIQDPNAPYWRQLVVEGQVSHYMMLEWLNGRKVDEAVWDVMRKPSISPKAPTKAESTAVLNSLHYFGRKLSPATLAEFRETGRENHEMYESRLAHDCTTERPQFYFQRRTVPRLDADLHEYALELWGHSKDILYARTANRWPKNSGACMLYGSPCKFLGVCSGYTSLDSDKWARKGNVHSELPMLEGDGRGVLTNSRIRTFQTCRKKHYYEYELGIDLEDAEEREALVFGTLWHKALEAWFNTMKGQNDYNANSSPENGFGTATAATIVTPTAEPDFF